MENYTAFDALDEGIIPGGLRSKDEIKVLVCYLLKNIDGGLTREQIGSIMQERGIANYFEAMDAVSDLLSNGSVTGDLVDDKEYLHVTESGKEAVSLVEKDLPKTVRENAIRSAIHLITLERNAKENEVKIEPAQDGYTVTFTMKAGESTLMELSIFSGDRDLAEKVKDNFLEDPAKVYSSILAGLMIE